MSKEKEMSEKKLEECSLEQATHIEMGGKVYEFGNGFTSKGEVLKYNDYHIDVCRGTTGWQLIHVDTFPILGIKPLKKKPIKFYHTFGGPYAPPNEAYGKTFLCVEFLKEEKK